MILEPNPSRRTVVRRAAPLVQVLIGNGIFMFSQWCVLILLVRYRGSADAGEYVLATTLFTPVFMCAGMKLRQAYVSDAAGTFSAATYRRLRLLATAAAVTTCIGLAIAWPASGSFWPLAVVIFADAGEAQSDFHYAVMQRAGNFKAFSRSLGFRGVLGVVIAGALLWLGASQLVALSAWACSWWFSWFAIDRRFRPDEWGMTDIREVARLARILLPLGVSTFAVSLATSVPRLAVARYEGIATLGVFGSIYMLFTAGLFALEASSDVLLRPLAAAHARGDRSVLRRSLVRGVQLGIATMAAGLALTVLGADRLLSLIYGASFGQFDSVLSVLTAALGLQVVTMVARTAVLASGAFGTRLKAEAAALLMVVASSALLVPWLGLVGAAWATVVLAASQCAGSLTLIHRAASDGGPSSETLSS